MLMWCKLDFVLHSISSRTSSSGNSYLGLYINIWRWCFCASLKSKIRCLGRSVWPSHLFPQHYFSFGIEHDRRTMVVSSIPWRISRSVTGSTISSPFFCSSLPSSRRPSTSSLRLLHHHHKSNASTAFPSCTDYTPLTTNYSRHLQQQHVLNETCLYASRLFASSSQDNPTATTTTTTTKKKDLRESIERLKGESKDNGAEGASSTSSSDDGNNPYVEKLSSIGSNFLDTLSQTWEELIASGQAKDINKKIGTVHPTNSDGNTAPNYANDDAAADKYESYAGSRDIMLIDPIEQLTAWERMQRRLRDTPIISDILDRTERVYEESGARDHITNTKQKIQTIKEDAAEAWETSQNPWVYRASSVYDTLTAESEFAIASKQLRILDPEFTLENWKRDVVDYTLPKIMKLFLEGRITELKPWLGEAVYNRLAAEVRARKKEGVQMDTNVLAIMNAEILACEVEGSSVNVERGSDPIILLHFMCQQIHCVRKKVVTTTSNTTTTTAGSSSSSSSSSTSKDEKETNNEDIKEEVDEENRGTSSSRTYMDEELGDIVEGSEDDIRANSYVVAFQREYNEEKMELNWKIVDFRFNGAIAYL